MGEPAGIGPDIALAAWSLRKTAVVPAFVIIGSAQALIDRRAILGLENVWIETVSDPADALRLFETALPVIDLGHASAAGKPGVPDPNTAHLTIAAIRKAVDLTLDGQCTAVVTNPIAKDVLLDAGFEHAGHTEFLAQLATERFGSPFRAVMLMASDQLLAVPLTIHIPLAEVPALITEAAIAETAQIMDRELKRYFGFAEPRVAVCGLNPHSGENGKLGREDADVIEPAIQRLRNQGLRVSGPFPADTLFHESQRSQYDAVLAMYHDQALIPFKMLSFEDGVNVTLGLPFIRTSPDHGTAFALAGTGKANPSSLIAALKLADRMARTTAHTAP
jgi:4-hydroxythreonine-4-phosphate dehydrogenase